MIRKEFTTNDCMDRYLLLGNCSCITLPPVSIQSCNICIHHIHVDYAGDRATQEQVAETHCNYSATKHNGTQMTQINMINADNSIKILYIIIISVICVPFFQLLSQHLNRQ